MAQREPSEKLMRARCRLMTKEPWYGHMAMDMEWIPSDMSWVDDPEKRTMGIRINGQGIVQCFYNNDWIDATDLRKIYGVIEHGINHLVRLHTLRTGGRDLDGWAMACDMVVNGKAAEPLIGFREDNGERIMPFDDMVFTPPDWPSGETAEAYYEKLEGKGNGQGQKKSGGQGNSQGNGNGQGDSEDQQGGQGGQPGHYNYNGSHGRACDDHSTWDQSEVSEDEARQIVHDMVKGATEKSQGSMPGHFGSLLESLSKPVVRWRELLRSYLGNHVGNRRRTYSRANRRTQEFGSKGISRHAAATVTVIVDTSGSIGEQELGQFFAEIEAVCYRAKTFLLQWDAAFQGYARYRRGDWKRLTVNGRGGTDMSAPYDWIDDNVDPGDVVVLLTDGYTNWPTPRPYPALFVITTPESVTPGPDWGHVIRMQALQ